MRSHSIPNSCTVPQQITSFMELKNSLLIHKNLLGYLFHFTWQNIAMEESTVASCDRLLNCCRLSPAQRLLVQSPTGLPLHQTLTEGSSRSSFTIWWITLTSVPAWAECLALSYGTSRSICNRVASQNEITLWTPPKFFCNSSVAFSESVEITVTNL